MFDFQSRERSGKLLADFVPVPNNENPVVGLPRYELGSDNSFARAGWCLIADALVPFVCIADIFQIGNLPLPQPRS